MKRNTLLLLLGVFILFSCGSTPTTNDGDTKVIKINGTLLNFTKATDTSFEEGDQVGVFINKTASNASVMSNGKFIYGSSGFTPEKEHNWYTGEETSRVFSYYPYKSSFTEAFATGKLMLDIKANQSIPTSYTASDFIIGKLDEISPTDKEINITFKHLLTKVVVNVNNQTEKLVTALTISGFNGSVEYNFVDLSITEKVITITPIKFNSPNAGFTNSFAAIIPPQEAQPRLDITINEKIHKVTLDATVILLSSKQLSINIDIKNDAPEEFVFTITTKIIDWEDDNELIFNFKEDN